MKSKRRRRPLKLRLDLGMDSNAVAPATVVVTPRGKKAMRLLSEQIGTSCIPFAPHSMAMESLASKVAGVKSGQGALYVMTKDPVTGAKNAYKGKIFCPDAECTELPVTHPTIKGFIIAPFTHLLSPETVVPSLVCKTDKGALIFMQPMQHGFIDFYRYHQEWVQKAENQGNVVDCLESLFQARPDIEENFILASLTDLTH